MPPFTVFMKASAQAVNDFHQILGVKQSSCGLCCAGNPIVEHIHNAQSLAAKASHQFGRAAAIAVDANAKVAVRSAEQRAIDSYALGKQAEAKLIALQHSSVARNSIFCVSFLNPTDQDVNQVNILPQKFV